MECAYKAFGNWELFTLMELWPLRLFARLWAPRSPHCHFPPVPREGNTFTRCGIFCGSKVGGAPGVNRAQWGMLGGGVVCGVPAERSGMPHPGALVLSYIASKYICHHQSSLRLTHPGRRLTSSSRWSWWEIYPNLEKQEQLVVLQSMSTNAGFPLRQLEAGWILEGTPAGSGSVLAFPKGPSIVMSSMWPGASASKFLWQP